MSQRTNHKHPATDIIEDSTHRFITDLERGGYANKVDSGDIEITDPTKGYIGRTPNGTRVRLTFNDDLSISLTAL